MDRRTGTGHARARQRAAGQVLVEFSLIALMFFGLVVALFDLAMLAGAQNSMNQAVREAARWGTVDGHWTDVSGIESRATQGLLFITSSAPVVSCEWVGSSTPPAGSASPSDCTRPGYVLRVSLSGSVPLVFVGGTLALTATSRMAVH